MTRLGMADAPGLVAVHAARECLLLGRLRPVAVYAQSPPTRGRRVCILVPTPHSIPLRTGRPRLVVLGTGWAAARLARDIDPKQYDLTVSDGMDPSFTMSRAAACMRLHEQP
jgi:hypothetical protein